MCVVPCLLHKVTSLAGELLLSFESCLDAELQEVPIRSPACVRTTSFNISALVCCLEVMPHFSEIQEL